MNIDSSFAPQIDPAQADVDQAAFEFVRNLATELSGGKIDIPSFPDIALRVQLVLSDEDVSPDKIVRVVSSEPILATRLLQIANSAAMNVNGKHITELRAAVTRLGFNMVRGTAIAFAMSQLKKADELKGMEKQLDELWRRSAEVAAMSLVVARRFTRVSPDTAMLTGMLHSIGDLYILSRSGRYPALFNDPVAYNTIVRDWRTSVTKALLENWEISDEIIQAVNEYEDQQRQHDGPPDLCDVLSVAYLLVAFKDFPDDIELNMHGVSACQRMRLDRPAYDLLIQECANDLASLMQALGV